MRQAPLSYLLAPVRVCYVKWWLIHDVYGGTYTWKDAWRIAVLW